MARKAAQEDLEATKAQLRASREPLLIGVLPNGPVTPDMEASLVGGSYIIGLSIPTVTASTDPRRVAVDLKAGYVSFPLRNVGPGVARVIAGKIECEGGWEVVGLSTDRELVPTGETTRVNISLAEIQDPDTSVIAAVVPYSDLADEVHSSAVVILEREPGEGWRVKFLIPRPGSRTPLPSLGGIPLAITAITGKAP